MKVDLPISKDYVDFLNSKLNGSVCIGIDGFPFFADFFHCSFSLSDNSITCCFKIDCEVNRLDET